jgi:hypothetical protein
VDHFFWGGPVVRNYKAILLTGFILFPLMYAFFELFLQANLPMGILI